MLRRRVAELEDVVDQLRKVERRLQESESKFRLVFEKSVDPILLLDGDRFIDANEAAVKILGLDSKDQLMGLHPSQISPEFQPDGRRSSEKEKWLLSLTAREGGSHFEWVHRTLKGADLWVEVSLTTIPVLGRALTHVVWRDVTKKKEAENSLRKSEEKYRGIFENAVEGIFQSTPKGRFLSVNPAFVKMCGYDSAEEMIESITDMANQHYVNPEKRELFKQLLATQGSVQNFEHQIRRKDGGIVWVSVNARAVRDEKGGVLYYEGTHENITDRKRTEEKLLESEERYRMAIEHSNDGVALVSGDRHIYVNQKFLQMFGYERPDEIIGGDSFVVVHPDDRERVRDYTRRRQAGEQVPSRYTFRGIRKDGTSPYIETSVASVAYHGQQVSLAYLRDITDRKLLEERLRTMSVMDELTGLCNRRGFFALAQRQLKLAVRSGEAMDLLFMDLDNMKWINDELGHHEGDRALVDIATILKETFRESDVVARMGGDEFAALVVDTAGEACGVVVKRLTENLSAFNGLRNRGYSLSVSVGMARYDPANPLTLDELLGCADTLMYEEKRRKQG
jgi:Amt family ammonium transporter